MNVKRALALSLTLLLLVTLLTGCAGVLLPGREKENETADPTDEPAATEPASTEPASTEPAVRRPHAVEVGGVSIYVDDTRYERYQPVQEVCMPISDGPLNDFVPSTSYGDVFPYVAGRLFSSTEDGYSWGGVYLYGLADSEGRMLTDGIYADAYPLYCEVPGDYSSKQLPFLVVTRYRDASVIHHEYEYGEWDEVTAARESALISMDGTFVLPFSNCYVQGFPDCFIVVSGSTREDGTTVYDYTNFTVYDLQGNVLFRGSDLGIDSDCEYVRMHESEGILQVSLVWFGDDDSDRGHTDYYDLTGKHVLGPYQNGGAFSDGLACVSLDGTYYGYVDRSGTWVIEPLYLSCETFQNGYAVQRRSSGMDWETSVVLDTAGREVLTTDAEWVYLQDRMILVDYGYDFDRMASYSGCYDLNGNLLFEGWNAVERISDTAFLVREEQDGITARFVDNAHPEKNVTITNINSGVIKTAACMDGKLIKGYVCTDSSDRFYLIDEDTLEVTELPAGEISEKEMDYYYSTGRQVDAVTGKVWYLTREKGRWVLFNEDGNLILRVFSETVPSVTNGYICTTDETSCTVYDIAGNVVFRRRLDAED